MMNTNFDSYFDSLWAKCIKYKYELLSSLLFGFLTYTFYFTNMIYNHDSVNKLIVINADHYYRIGRWGTYFLAMIFPHPTMPWYDGVFSLILYSIGICLISNIFELNNKYIKILLSGIIISFPSICANYLYMFQAITFSLSFLLSSLSVYYLKYNQNKFAIFYSICAIVILLSFYQGLLAITTSLMVLYLIKMILNENFNNENIIRKGLVALFILIVGVVVYWLITHLVFSILGHGFDSYAENAMDSKDPFFKKLIWPYKYFFRELLPLKNNFSLIFFKWTIPFMWVSLIICFLSIIKKIKHYDFQRVFILLFLLLIYPISINFMYLAAVPRAMYSLPLIGFLSIYIFITIITESLVNKQVFKDYIKLFMCVILLSNIRGANMVAMYARISYENAFSFYTSLITQIKSSGLLDEKTSLAICGSPDKYIYKLQDLNNKHMPILPLIYIPYKQNFMKYYLGFDVPIVSLEEKVAISKRKEFKQMEIYPNPKSISKIGNIIVVKLNENINNDQ